MKHESVNFHWYGPESEDTDLTGQVLTRPGDAVPEMVLDINDPAGEGPYLIIGKMPRGRSYFAGINTSRNRQNDVAAAWARVDVGFVRRWVEAGVEYLFSFEVAEENVEET